jgi:hypothetical protein
MTTGTMNTRLRQSYFFDKWGTYFSGISFQNTVPHWDGREMIAECRPAHTTAARGARLAWEGKRDVPQAI